MRQASIHEGLKSLKYLSKPPNQAKEEENPFNDPATTNALFMMFRSNLMNYIPQTVIMWWVNYFFAGFVIMKLPFPLTLRFKSMLQNGVQTQDLDVRWVSSISWYFVNLLGLRSIYSLILENSDDVNEIMSQQLQNQQVQAPMMPAQQQMEKVFTNELQNILIQPFKSCLDDVEQRILKLY